MLNSIIRWRITLYWYRRVFIQVSKRILQVSEFLVVCVYCICLFMFMMCPLICCVFFMFDLLFIFFTLYYYQQISTKQQNEQFSSMWRKVLGPLQQLEKTCFLVIFHVSSAARFTFYDISPTCLIFNICLSQFFCISGSSQLLNVSSKLQYKNEGTRINQETNSNSASICCN